MQQRTGRVPALILRTRGIREEIGRALGEAAKCVLTAALENALYRLRHPRFDNAPLREPPGP